MSDQNTLFEWITMIGGLIGGAGGVAAAFAAMWSARISYNALLASRSIINLTQESVRFQQAATLRDIHPIIRSEVEGILSRNKDAFDQCEALIVNDTRLIEAALEAHHGKPVPRPFLRRINVLSVSPAEVVKDHYPMRIGIDHTGPQGIRISFDCYPICVDMANAMARHNEALDLSNEDIPRFGAHYVFVQSSRLYEALWKTLHQASRDMHTLRDFVFQYGAEDLALSLIGHDWRANLAYNVMLTGFKAPTDQIRHPKLSGMNYVVEHARGQYSVIRAKRMD